MRKLPIILTLLGATTASSVALAQGASRLYPVGAETKVHAGAGQIASRGAPANYYNPANLAETTTPELYGELDVISVSYTFEYPGYDPVKVAFVTPAPYFGFAFAPVENLAIGISALALPAGGGTTLKDFPTREFAEDADSDPILVDVETGGKGVSYSGSLGVAYKFLESYSGGLSLLFGGGTSTLKATEADGDGVLAESKTRSYSYQFLLGGNAKWWGDRIDTALTVRTPAQSRSKGRTEYPALGGGVDTKSSGKGPVSIGLAGSIDVTKTLSPFVELLHTNWKALRSDGGDVIFDRVQVDYYDTNDLMAGVNYLLGKNQITVAAGFFQSELGDGVMAKEADDGKELIGYEMQNVEAIGFTTYSAGYKIALKKGHLQTGFTYTAGDREVKREARGYGTYKLRYMSLVAGGIWRL